MIVAVPAVPPVTVPPATLATVVALLDHVPPDVALLRTVVLPEHTNAEPVIAAGGGFTVTVAVLKQPVAAV